MRRTTAALILLSAVAAGCGDSSDTTAPPPWKCPAGGTQGRVVTADWLAGSLTIFDLERLVDPACSVDEARDGTVDLSAFPPGPLEVEIAPDKKTAVVAVGPGFFDGAAGAVVGSPAVPAGGALLVVDVEARAVVHEVAVEKAPMGIAIAPDGKTAFVTEYGSEGDRGSRLLVVDLDAGAVVDVVEVGEGPEQVRLDREGALGIVNVDSLGGVRVFSAADVASMSAAAPAGKDPGDIAWIAGTSRTVVTCSIPFSYSVVDASDPAAPTSLEVVELGGSPYAVTPVPGTTRVLAPLLITGVLLPIDAGATPSVELEGVPLASSAFTLGVAVDPSARWAFTAHASDRTLSIVDLEGGEPRGVTWLDATGPTYVAIAPP